MKVTVLVVVASLSLVNPLSMSDRRARCISRCCEGLNNSVFKNSAKDEDDRVTERHSSS